jgi:hypothetical protein
MEDYSLKYLKYKLKYFNLKNRKQNGGGDKIIGINYEGGKIISHILQYKNCIAYANIQIAMDAPYHGREAGEDKRSVGRSETFFPGYKEEYLISQLDIIFKYIKDNYKDTKIVIQIARGRSAIPMYEEILKPIIAKCEFINKQCKLDIHVARGYKTEDYYKPENSEVFVFVNIGMFAVLQEVEKVRVAEICNPNQTIDVLSKTDEKLNTNGLITYFNDDKNILNKILNIKKITLAGIADDMPFITKDVYPKKIIDGLLEEINRII